MDNIKIVKKRRFFNKFKQGIERFLIYVFALIGMLATLNFAINTFREAGEWYFNKPVGIVAPAVVHAESVGASSVNPEDKEEATPPPPLEEIINRIGKIESNNGETGHARTCKEKGLSNNYGYNLPACFQTDQEAREAVEWQLKKYADKGYDLEESLRIYNCGSPDCETDYVNKFKKGGGLWQNL